MTIVRVPASGHSTPAGKETPLGPAGQGETIKAVNERRRGLYGRKEIGKTLRQELQGDAFSACWTKRAFTALMCKGKPTGHTGRGAACRECELVSRAFGARGDLQGMRREERPSGHAGRSEASGVVGRVAVFRACGARKRPSRHPGAKEAFRACGKMGGLWAFKAKGGL